MGEAGRQGFQVGAAAGDGSKQLCTQGQQGAHAEVGEPRWQTGHGCQQLGLLLGPLESGRGPAYVTRAQ